MIEEHTSFFEAKKEGEEEEEKEEKVALSIIIKCKKTDGKGWHCKRLAQNPNSLCSHHLAQLRSYRSRFGDKVSGDRTKKSSFAVGHAGARHNYYYYYSILGPWWGKRRGPVDESGEQSDDDVVVDEEEDDDDDDDDSQRKKRRRVRKQVKARSLKSLLLFD